MNKLFWATLSFISRLPAPARQSQGLDFEHYSHSIMMSPLIGVVLGGLMGLVFVVLQPWYGISLTVLFVVLTLALLTGGFHLDGLADTCGGIFLTCRCEQMLEIMRDSRLGTHGGLALTSVLLAKILVVSELTLCGTSMLATLATARVAGRGAAVLSVYRYRYAREEGLGNVFIDKAIGRQTCITLGLTAIPTTVLLPGMHDVTVLIVTIVAIFILGQLLKRMLGGQTGGTLGAVIGLGELIFLSVLL